MIFWQHRMLQNQAAGTESIWTRKAIADLQKQSMKDLQDKEMRRSRYRERTDSFLRNNKRKSTKTILTKENKLCTIYLSKNCTQFNLGQYEQMLIITMKKQNILEQSIYNRNGGRDGMV